MLSTCSSHMCTYCIKYIRLTKSQPLYMNLPSSFSMFLKKATEGISLKKQISSYSSSSSSWFGTALYDDSDSPLPSCRPDHWKPRNKNVITARKAANSLYDARIPMAPISNPPSIVPPPVPTPTNRPFRIPVRINSQGNSSFQSEKSTEPAGRFICTD